MRAAHDADGWNGWMRGLGDSTRRLRTLLGLTQEQLGSLSGVSQGAISRLEGGRGMATPLLVVVRVQRAFQHCLERVDPRQVTPVTRSLLAEERPRALEPIEDFGDLPLLHDRRLEEYVQLWHRVHPARRDTYLNVVRAAAGAMAGAPEGSERPLAVASHER